jgi:hypothetical protein
MERNKELAPFGRWCNPTVSASGEAPCPSRASSTRHCPRPSGFARLVRSPCASGRSRLRTAKNTSSWPVRPAARKPRKAPSSPTSSSTYPPLRPPQILSSPSNGGRRGAISNATTLRVSIMRAKRCSERARRNTTTISWRLQAIAPRAMARRRS